MIIRIQKIIRLCFVFFFILNLSTNIIAHEIHNHKNNNKSFSSDNPDDYCPLVHTNGKLVLSAGNVSALAGFDPLPLPLRDCFTGEILSYKMSEFPKGSNIGLSNSINFWFGGVVGSDTLVTQNFYGEIHTNLDFTVNTNNEDHSIYSENAISELEIKTSGNDTTVVNSSFLPFYTYDTRPHKPIGLELNKSSYSWSYSYTEDFVLFDLTIKNISSEPIKDFLFAFNAFDGSGYSDLVDVDGKDDIIGFLQNYTQNNDCPIEEKLNMMWIADGDGDPYEGQFLQKLTRINDEFFRSATSVAGIFHLTDYSNVALGVRTSYNWWASSAEDDKWFMPIRRTNSLQDYNQKNSHPFGDNLRYAIMSNNEIDYDQIYTASISQYDPVWQYPNQLYAADISNGFSPVSQQLNHTHHILSVGPFDIPPGAVLKIPFAYVAGENFHRLPTNGNNLPDNPDAYYSNLDFSDLAKNAQWARWIYDNPGVDTDGDGDSGLYKVCVLDSQLVDDEWVVSAADTFWYQGDGVPDWRAAGPPPAPYFWLEPVEKGIRIRFNGSRSETEKDIFTQIVDFEGYNIYFGRDEREASLSIIASLDFENYDKYIYNVGVDLYIVGDVPLTIEDIRCTYADSCYDESFDPLQFTRVHPMFIGDSLIFFRKHSYNVSDNTIKKVFPNARDPRLIHIDSLVDDDYTNDGYFKFFEYEYFIENLLPTVSYWINVTAFDFGSPKSGLPALETSKTLNIQEAFPLVDADESSDSRKQVYVYPNPYRIDAEYRKSGFEGRTQDDRPDYRVRALNFANLPPQCEIKIFSLDGDLIRHLSHDYTFSDPTHRHHKWDLITRNTQMIVSGLYYWTVEFPDGEVQVGKFVVIM